MKRYAMLFAAVAACSSGEPRISTATSALDEVFPNVIENGNALVAGFVNELHDSTVLLSNGRAFISLEPTLAGKLGLPGPLTFQVVPTSQSFSGVEVDLYDVYAAIDMASLQIELDGSDIVATVSGNGGASAVISYAGLSVSPTLHLPAFNVTLRVGWDPYGEHLFIEPRGVTLSAPGASITDCGDYGWCDLIANTQLPMLEAALADRIASGLAPLLASNDLRLAFERFVLMVCSEPAPKAPPQGAGPWRFNYGGGAIKLTIASDLITCELHRDDEPAPTIDSVVPSKGGPGDTVVIHAHDLGVPTTGATITFGTIPVTTSVCNQGMNNSDCIAVVPPGAGTVDVRITNPAGVVTGTTPGDVFSYQELTVQHISPDRGAITGGTMVRIDGSGFDVDANADGSTKVFFGGMAAPGLYCTSSTTCFAPSPADANVGPVDVVVTMLGRQSATSANDLFTYAANPALVELLWSPSSGGKATIDSAAPPGGANVVLASDDPTFMVPPSTVTIPEGQTSATFWVSFAKPSGSTTLRATYQGTTLTATVAKDIVCPNGTTWDETLSRCVRVTCRPGTCS